MQRPSVGIVLTGAAALVAVIAIAFRTDPVGEVSGSATVPGVAVNSNTSRSYRLYDDSLSVLKSFAGGCALISRFMNAVAKKDECPDSQSVSRFRRMRHVAPGASIARVLVVSLPDPADSHLDWLYDGNIDAIRRALAIAGYVPDAFKLQDEFDSLATRSQSRWSPMSSGSSFPLVSPARKYHPGVLLFRRNTSVLTDPALWLVYVVPELPTTGWNKAVFRAAMSDRARLVQALGDSTEASVLRILGPTFTGSATSISLALSSLKTEIAGLRNVDIVTGSATSIDQSVLAGQIPVGSEGAAQKNAGKKIGSAERSLTVSVRSTVHSDATLLRALSTLLKKLEVNDEDVAILRESQTSYGSQDILSRYLTVPFPLNIASLRAEFDRSAEALEEERELPGIGNSAATVIEPENGTAAKESPKIASRLTVPSVDVMIRDIEQTLTSRGTKLVVILATDVRDKLMLMRAIRRRMRDVTFVIFENNVLFLRPEYRRATRGAYILSTYPLTLQNETWQRRSGSSELDGNGLSAFASDVSVGAYNATLTLLNKPTLRRQYAPPGYGAADGLLPPVWVTMVGNDAFLPLYFTFPSKGDLRYFGDRFAHDAAPENSALGRRVLLSGISSCQIKDSVLSAVSVEKRSDIRVPSCLDSLIAAPIAPVDSFGVNYVVLPFILALLVLAALGTVAFLFPTPFETFLPQSVRPAKTGTELTFAALFLTWCICAAIPVMTQIELGFFLAEYRNRTDSFPIAPTIAIISVASIVGLAFVAFRRLHITENSSSAGLSHNDALGKSKVFFMKGRAAPAVRWQGFSGKEPGSSQVKTTSEDFRRRDEYDYRFLLLRRVASAAVLGFCGLFVTCTCIWSFNLLSVAKKDEATSALFLFRASDLFSGGSPMMVLMLVAFVFMIWSKWQYDVVKDIKRPSDFEIALKDVGRDSTSVSPLRNLGHDMWRCRATLADLIPDESAIWLTIGIVVATLLLIQYGRTPEALTFPDSVATPFHILIFSGLLGALIVIAVGILRFTAAWQTLQTLLDLFAGCRIIKVFGAIPTDVVRAARPALWGEHSWSSPGFGIRRFPVRLDEIGDTSVEADFRPRVIQTSKDSIEGLPELSLTQSEESVTAPHDYKILQRAALLLEKLGYFDEVGDEISEQHRVKSCPTVSAKAQNQIATYFALEVGFFVARIMFVLRRLAVVLVLSLLVVVMLTAIYPFPSQSLIRWGVTSLMVFALASLLTVIARMSSNSVLRQVTQTEEGASLGATAVFNLLVFAVVPLMGFLATDIPILRSFLVSWIEPLARALTK